MSSLPPRPRAFDFEDHAAQMALIHVTCAAEDAAREVTAPYNTAVTAGRLQEVQLQLADALRQQLARGRHMRMDIVLSLQQKTADVGARLAPFIKDVSPPPPEPDVLA